MSCLSCTVNNILVITWWLKNKGRISIGASIVRPKYADPMFIFAICEKTGVALSIWYRTIVLTYWGRVTHICVKKLIIIGSDNGLSPSRHQAISWTNGGILLIRNLETNLSEILSEIYTFSFKKIHLKMSSGICRPSCLGLNMLNSTKISVMSANNPIWQLNPLNHIHACPWLIWYAWNPRFPQEPIISK